MPDFPSQSAMAVPLHISDMSLYGGIELQAISAGGTPGSGTWVANLAMFMPLELPFPYLVRRVWWVNGSTTTATNVDMGIYTADGTRLFSTGSTAQGTASDVQYVALGTPIVLSPGNYYLAWTCDNTTSRAYIVTASALQGEQAGIVQQATALPLPATMTPAAYAGQGVPYCGITQTASGF